MRNKLISIFLVLVAIAGVGAITAFSFIKKNNICAGVELKVVGDSTNAFISKDDVEGLLNSLYVIRPGETKTTEINTLKLETLIKQNPYVVNANCFFAQSGKLIVEVEPKHPVIRVFNGEDISYYLQEDGRIIPLSPTYVADVPTFTIDKLEADISGQHLKQKMLFVGKLIAKDELWNAAAEQIHVTADGQFSMYTSLANHAIVLGDTSAFTNKLERLKYFYQNVMPKRGWNKYSKIDLRYNAQIVASNIDGDGIVPMVNSIETTTKSSAKSSMKSTAKSFTKTDKEISHKSFAVAAVKPRVVKNTNVVVAKASTSRVSKADNAKSINKANIKPAIAKPIPATTKIAKAGKAIVKPTVKKSATSTANQTAKNKPAIAATKNQNQNQNKAKGNDKK